MTGMTPEHLGNKLIFRGNISGKATRKSQQLNIPLFKTKTGRNPFLIELLIWNNLPFEISLANV